MAFQTETGDTIEVFTTRPDTLWGATFMVLAPEHPLVETLTTDEQRAAVTPISSRRSRETEIERLSTDPRENRCLYRWLRHQPGQRRTNAGLDRRLRPGMPTAPARSWPSRRTTSVTSSLR